MSSRRSRVRSTLPRISDDRYSRAQWGMWLNNPMESAKTVVLSTFVCVVGRAVGVCDVMESAAPHDRATKASSIDRNILIGKC